MKEKEYVIFINGELVPVSKKVYETYYRSKNREKYLEKRDQKKGLIYYNSFDSERGNFEEYLEDKAINIEQIVEAKLLME